MTVLVMEFASFAPVSDLSQVVLVEHSVESYVESVPGSVRRYAGGRLRVVSTPGVSAVVQVKMDVSSRAAFAALRELRGVPVLFRDHAGRRVFGVFHDVSGEELLAHPDLVGNVSFSITEVSFSEVV